MGWNLFGRKKKRLPGEYVRAANNAVSGAPPAQDTRAAIEELSRVVKNNPEAVEIYLALGNLYRSQGEIERAIQIRNSLIVRPGLDSRFKARALFELGRDFRRGGFLDRAGEAFRQAREAGCDPNEILLERAKLNAERGVYEEAAEDYGRLKLPLPQAHYLYRHARDLFADDQPSQGKRMLKQAVKVYPGAFEAWSEMIVRKFRSGNASRAADLLSESLESVAPDKRFVMLHELLTDVRRAQVQTDSPLYQKAASATDIADRVTEVIEKHDPDILLFYYGALLLQLRHDPDEARNWLEKALVLQPDFWLARLELFDMSRSRQSLTPFFKEQLGFFMSRARGVRRFFCSRCGLKRDAVFHICPRCGSWHSITFRTEFTN
ncbi:tetratricopeptide repeat protein [Salidesulfovibrio brasiliensis]|uniref:tetratricopeptide repeat protein n=1 Tax=Salidesulfovibrio brasiliensis TaxID=221711 RepID=UPI0006CF4233|nr:tetratricopeptide repeat protein [Salidesulfovibrio brasiliensis]